MEVLLVSPPLSVEDRYGKALGKVGSITEPLGLAYLASALRNKGHYVEILDCSVRSFTMDKLDKKLLERSWSLVGLSILTPMYLRARETVSYIKSKIKTKVVVGGPHVTIFPKQTMEENPDFDLGVVGEGEVTITELVEALESGSDLHKVKGIVFRDKDGVHLTEPRSFTKNLDDVDLPARDLLDMSQYVPAPTYYKGLPSFVMLTSRGCPYRCSYCSKIAGNIYRFHSIERILQEVNLLIDDYHAKEIIFRDDTFTINKDHVKRLCGEFIRLGINKKIRWTCMTRVNLVDEELLALMAEAGCWSIHYGVESGSQRLLDLIQKDITLEQVRNAFRWTRKYGIEIKAFFMLGLPSETYEESLKTLEITKELDPDWIQVTITVPYPGTKLYELAKADGTLKSFKWEDYQTWAAWSDKELVYLPSSRNPEELKALQKRAMREFYFRPRFIFRQFKNFNSLSSIKMYLRGAYGLLGRSG